ncbi:MAG: hypothetical protein ACOYNZ_04065 [Rhodoferax sp.]
MKSATDQQRPLACFCIAVLVSALLSVSACASLGAASAPAPSEATLTIEQIAQIVGSLDRSAADRNNDLRRKPEQMLAFIGIRPGMMALDLSTGGGYTAELLARAVGPSGTAYGQSQPPRSAQAAARPAPAPEGNSSPQLAAVQRAPDATPAVRRTSVQAIEERARNPALSNLFAVVRPFEDPVPLVLKGKLIWSR